MYIQRLQCWEITKDTVSMKQEQDSVKKHIQRSEQRSKKEIYDNKNENSVRRVRSKNLGKSKKQNKKTKEEK